jgi:hypothetical protein
MSAIFRKLTGRRLPLTEMADILERHLAQAQGDHACLEACDALRRVRRETSNFYVRAALRFLDRDCEPCARVRKVIAALRKWRYASGA